MKRQALNLFCAAALVIASEGCGTGANLAGLSVSANVAQKGQVVAANFAAGTNVLTIGGSYTTTNNSYGGEVTVPTK